MPAHSQNNTILASWFSGLDEQAAQKTLKQYLLSRPLQKINEVELMRLLEQQGCFEGLQSLAPMLLLFAKHFFVRRSLYALAPELSQPVLSGREHAYTLAFDIAGVQLNPCAPASLASGAQLSLSKDHLIAEFYGDIDQLLSADEHSVTDLLAGFWRRYAAFERGEGAYAVLGIPPDADWETIRMAYRKLAAQSHPDKGGTAAEFATIKAAYDDLKQLKGKS